MEFVSEFILTQRHITLLQRANIRYDGAEFGAPCIDPKRPYGNSSVVHDIAEILDVNLPDEDEDPHGYDDVESELVKIHDQLTIALQIIVQQLPNVRLGRYGLVRKYGNEWEYVE